jgi:hypothetical protein
MTDPLTVLPLPTIRAALDLPTEVLDDVQLQSIVYSCAEIQAAYLAADAPEDSAALWQALLRRVGRAVSARGLPLGAQNTEFGTTYVPAYDPILQELEAPYRAPVIA